MSEVPTRPRFPLGDSSGAWSVLGHPETADALAELGFGWICLDAQHGHWSDDSMLRALRLGADRSPILVRVRENTDGLIGRALDGGAAGVIVPMVSNQTTAENAVAASSYPPRGHRSWGPMTTGTGPADQPFCAVMIETTEALEQADAIASVPGLGGLFVGPFDLALALDESVDTLLEDGHILRRIAQTAAASGIAAGAFAGSPERGRRLRELGYTFVAITGEVDLFTRGAAALRAG